MYLLNPASLVASLGEFWVLLYGQIMFYPQTLLGVPSPFFPGILGFSKSSKTQGKQPVIEKNDD